MCTFCVLGDDVNVIQNGNVNVTGGNMWFNGDVAMGPNGVRRTPAPGTVVGDDGSTFVDGGNIYVSGAITSNCTKVQGGGAQVGQPRVVDPLAAQVLPFVTQSALVGKTVSPCSGGPGIYGDVNLRPGTCTLIPGLYVFTGKLDLAGGATLIGNGVTFYFTCGEGTVPRACNSPGEDGGRIDSTGTPEYQLTAPPLRSTHPTVASELYGYSLVFDRYNTSVQRLRGNTNSFVSGTIYGVNATLDIGGTAGSTTPFSSWVVIGTLKMNGSPASLTVNFDASKNAKASEGARGLVR